MIKTNALTNTDRRSNNADVRAESKTASAPYSCSKHSDMKTATSSTYNCSRPAWSLTEDVAVAELEEKEVDDEDALLSFAEDLDFDRCMGDMEVQDVMERLSLRISAMEREAAMELQRDEELQRRAEKRKDVLSVVQYCPNLLPDFFLSI